MGHRRTGTLPRTTPWRQLVRDIHDFSGDEEQLRAVVRKTIENVRTRFLNVERDAAVNDSFRFLVALAVASQAPDPVARLRELALQVPEDDTPLALASALDAAVRTSGGSPEYASIAKAAACDGLARCHEQWAPDAPSLFGEEREAFEVWRPASTGSGFCELARLYFASFTERYLKYFLEREASHGIRTLFERDEFERQLSAHVEKVSRHAFETAKITQSFAAGWFNKFARDRMPSDDSIRRFLSLAFRKLCDELHREAAT